MRLINFQRCMVYFLLNRKLKSYLTRALRSSGLICYINEIRTHESRIGPVNAVIYTRIWKRNEMNKRGTDCFEHGVPRNASNVIIKIIIAVGGGPGDT